MARSSDFGRRRVGHIVNASRCLPRTAQRHRWMTMVLRFALLSIALLAAPLAKASYAEACVLEGQVVSDVAVSDVGAPPVQFSLAVATALRDDTSPLMPDADCSYWIGQIVAIVLQERIPIDTMPRQGSTVRVQTEAVMGRGEHGEVMLRTFRFLGRIDRNAQVSSSRNTFQRASATSHRMTAVSHPAQLEFPQRVSQTERGAGRAR